MAAGKVASTYGYVSGGYGTNSTTTLVASITQPGASFSYAYDSRGNIVSEKRGTLTTTYAYDALGQLIRVNDPHENVTWVYNYDRGGNITSKVKYAYTTGALGTAQQTISYTYGDSNWKDKLTAYNGKAISYDAIGNPLSDGTWTYTWQAGRQLKQMSKSGTTVQFKYDHNGLRTQKIATVNGSAVTTNYVLHGKLLMHMTQGSNKLHFFYDAQTRPAFVDYNGTKYTYVLNLHGDIVALLDSNGETMVEYKYDAWGKPISTTGTMAATLGKLNPFRYRGYIYDEEMNLYYLESRYYEPSEGRFINLDNLLRNRKNVLNSNIFIYCENNPTAYADPNGHIFSVCTVVSGIAPSKKGITVKGSTARYNGKSYRLNDPSTSKGESIGSIPRTLAVGKANIKKEYNEEWIAEFGTYAFDTYPLLSYLKNRLGVAYISARIIRCGSSEPYMEIHIKQVKNISVVYDDGTYANDIEDYGWERLEEVTQEGALCFSYKTGEYKLYSTSEQWWNDLLSQVELISSETE